MCLIITHRELRSQDAEWSRTLRSQALGIGDEVMAIAKRAAAWPGVAALRLRQANGFLDAGTSTSKAIWGWQGTGLVGAEA